MMTIHSAAVCAIPCNCFPYERALCFVSVDKSWCIGRKTSPRISIHVFRADPMHCGISTYICVIYVLMSTRNLCFEQKYEKY